jgi:hypothetical protein
LARSLARERLAKAEHLVEDAAQGPIVGSFRLAKIKHVEAAV